MLENWKVGEVAHLFDVNHATVHRWLKQGLLKGQKHPKAGVWEIPPRAIVRFKVPLRGRPPKTDPTEGMPEGRCYSFGDICKLYRVSPKVVSRWIRQGKLKASQAGPHMRTYILPEDLHDFEVRMELWTDPNPHQYLDDAPEQKSLAE